MAQAEKGSPRFELFEALVRAIAESGINGQCLIGGLECSGMLAEIIEQAGVASKNGCKAFGVRFAINRSQRTFEVAARGIRILDFAIEQGDIAQAGFRVVANPLAYRQRLQLQFEGTREIAAITKYCAEIPQHQSEAEFVTTIAQDLN